MYVLDFFQLESSRGSMGDYQSYMSNHLVPCMSQLAVAANSVPLWKQMNTLILGKTACSSVRVSHAVSSSFLAGLIIITSFSPIFSDFF